MAAAFGHASSSESSVSVTSLTWAHDCTGDNYLFASTNHRNNPSTASGTYNGSSMTLLDSESATYNWQEFFGIASPATGSNNIQISWVNSVNVGGCGISVSGYVSLGAMLGASVAAGAADYGPSDTLTANDILVGFSGQPDYSPNISVVQGTQRAETNTPSPVDCTVSAATHVGTGTVQILWDYTSAGDPKTFVGVTVVGAGAASPRLLSLLGAGT